MDLGPRNVRYCYLFCDRPDNFSVAIMSMEMIWVHIDLYKMSLVTIDILTSFSPLHISLISVV